MSGTGYLLNNQKVEAGQRFAALSALYDAGTVRQVEACGITLGWHCWEVGAGGPFLPRLMAGLVGPSGRVLATDIDVSWARETVAQNVEVRTQDVSCEYPSGELFDLIHARLVLVHIVDRERAFLNMLSALKPGGWLVVEDADAALQPLSCLDVYGPDQELANKIRMGFRSLLSKRGVDLAYGRKLPQIFRGAGLANIAAEAYFPVALPECSTLEIATINLIRNDLLTHGIATSDEIGRHLENVRAGRLDIAQPPLISVRGRKPASEITNGQ